MSCLLDSCRTILCRPDGSMKMVYTDSLDIAAFGAPQIQRASSVEPDENGQWWADLQPCGGPRLGPYSKRFDALNAEVIWLENNAFKE